MTDAVHAMLLRLELHQRIEEVGHAEALVAPAAEVARQRLEVRGIVRERRSELLDRVHDRRDVRPGGLMMRGIRDGAICRLQRMQRLSGRLQRPPGGCGLG